MPDEDARQQLLAHIARMAARPIEESANWRFQQQLLERIIAKGLPIELAFDVVCQVSVTLDENFDKAHLTKLAEDYAVYLLKLWEASHRLVQSTVHGTHVMGKQYPLTTMVFLRNVATMR